jgi:glutathione S-transferase
MLKIWGRANSANVQKVTWCCAEIDLPFDREDTGGEFGRTRDPDMLARNRNARVPTVDDDGFVLWESNAIVRYLAAKHAMGTLYPEDLQARADADRWMDWQQTTVLGPMTTIFWGLVREPGRFTKAQIEQAIEEAVAVWQILDQRLEGRDWLLGDTFTMADIPLGIQAYRWLTLVDKRPAMPAFEAWYERVRARSGFDTHIASIPLT